MKKPKCKPKSNFTITAPDKLAVKPKAKSVDKLEKSTWMKIDDKSIDRDLGFNADGKYLEVWE